MLRFLVCVGATLAILALPSFGQAVWFVDANAAPPGNGSAAAPFTTIQAAIVAASDGDTVRVDGGTYAESISFLGKAITVQGIDAATCIIDAGGMAPTVTFDSGEGDGSILVRVTVRGGAAGAGSGGGIVIDGADPQVRDCIITGNSAASGAGLWIGNGSAATIERCTIFGNVASSRGGGVQVSGSTPRIDRCEVHGNSANFGGGLHYTAGAAGVFSNSVVRGNSATTIGGGIDSVASSPTLVHLTIAANTAGSAGGGVGGFNASPLAFGSIVWGNLPDALDLAGGSPSFGFCDVEGGVSGPGNIDADPLFAGAALGDFRLDAGSPCINAGDVTQPALTDFDLSGEARIVGLGVDIGAHEFAPRTGTFVDRARTDDLRIVSYNPKTNRIFPASHPVEAAKFARLVAALDPDILALQEVGMSAAATVSLMNTIAPLPGGASWFGHKASDAVIISRYPLSMTATATIPAGQGAVALALVDLPDWRFDFDLYLANDHFNRGGAGSNPARQRQADALTGWFRDARTPGGFIDLPAGTAMAIVGDLNINNDASSQPITTIVTGDIVDEVTYGPDAAPDWDGTDITDSHPLHNVAGPDDYTWRDDLQPFLPSRLDYIIYTDSVLQSGNRFVLNSTTMTVGELQATGLQPFDVTLDQVGAEFDHLPVVCDLRPSEPLLPGSGEDFRMLTTINGAGAGTASVKSATAGDLLAVSFDSPQGTFVGAAPLLAAEIFAPGSAPMSPTGFPEVHVHPIGAFALWSGGTSLFGPVLLPVDGINLLYQVPSGLAGFTARLQAIAGSGLALNSLFATSDAHDITVF